MTLWDEFIKQAGIVNHPCNGSHTCGKCLIKPKTTLPLYDAEKLLLEQHHNDSTKYRLACFHKEAENEFELVLKTTTGSQQIAGVDIKGAPQQGSVLDAVVDIGTTTVVIVFVDTVTNVPVDQVLMMNPQSKYGTDVISRISSAGKYGTSPLQKILNDALNAVFHQVIEEYDVYIKNIFIAGNSTMLYLFLGKNPVSLGVYPFTCELKGFIKVSGSDVGLNSVPKSEVIVIPPISAYVGSDIVCGMLMIHDDDAVPSIIADLGTNGELVVQTERGFYATATAAGPAFEGANMICGMPCLSGAVYRVSLQNDLWKTETINNEEAVGICGSGYFYLIDQLLKHKKINASGYLKNEIELSSKVRLVQSDVRNFQLARSAIYTATSHLLKAADIKPTDVKKVYVAGGFSINMKAKEWAHLHLFPNNLEDQAVILGNSSLKGLLKFREHQLFDLVLELIARTTVIELNADIAFNEDFVTNLSFENETHSNL
jgi:uncharacterized 2Fe-2S/4Fe-4S cluster protein (DUF4445 family)